MQLKLEDYTGVINAYLVEEDAVSSSQYNIIFDHTYG